MATQTIKFTKAKLDGLPHPTSGRERYRDARYDNLYLEITTKSKTWRYRKYTRAGGNVTKTLGTWPHMDYVVAASKCGELDFDVAEGVDIRAPEAAREQRDGYPTTLGEAFEKYLAAPRNTRGKVSSKNEKTSRDFRSTMNLHASDWLDLPLDQLRKKDVNRRMNDMIETPYQANKLLRIVSGTYTHHMSVTDVDFEHDPTYKTPAYKTESRKLMSDVAKAWPIMDAIASVENARQRAMWGVMLFSGIRGKNIMELEWDQIDLNTRQITLQALKNKVDRTLPLSDFTTEILASLPRIHDRWVFASVTKDTHMWNLDTIPGIIRPHDTRHLFTTAAIEAGKSETQVDWLRGDVLNNRRSANNYTHSAADHDDVNEVAQQIVSRSSSSFDVAKDIFCV